MIGKMTYKNLHNDANLPAMRCHQLTNSEASAIRRKLLRWYERHRRELPWRKNRDPYRVWISEVMLQQTRVEAVIPYYENFLRRFPDLNALAAAKEQELLACWSGLGYYSRARNLQKAAQQIVNRHAGIFHAEAHDALALPGIGAYTAAAVLSIAYDAPLPVVDGNVARVLSRLFLLRTDIRNSAGKKRLLEHATALLAQRRPGDFNQAMMELGATVCVPQQPRCPLCPVRNHCRAFAGNQVEAFPPARAKVKPTLRRFTAALVLDGNGKCLLVRRPPEAQWMKGFWELPMKEETNNGHAPANSALWVKDGIVPVSLLGHVRHTITNNKIGVTVFLAQLRRPAVPPLERWVTRHNIPRIPVTTITRKALRLIPG